MTTSQRLSTSTTGSTPTITAATSTSDIASASTSTSDTGAVKDSVSESCSKCVRVLRDLVSGLHSSSLSSIANSTSRESYRSAVIEEDSKPLQLLRAIAMNSTSSDATSGSRSNTNNHVKIENVNDGIRVIVPVKTTAPNLLRRWSNWSQELDSSQDENDEDLEDLEPYTIATTSADTPNKVSALVATSAVNATSESDTAEPTLSIELKCRKCASTGPEGGARAFLMGPTPLSVVVCHNRISSSKQEIQEILTHELIHLYDVQTQQLDLQQCENLAYSEVRAAKHAECHNSWSQLQKYCVKQKAICATNNLFPQHGRKCIQKVFQKAYDDNRPFIKNKETN